jgi:hypothetical protein
MCLIHLAQSGASSPPTRPAQHSGSARYGLERWSLPDLDQFRLDKVIEIDTQPVTRRPKADSAPPQAI